MYEHPVSLRLSLILTQRMPFNHLCDLHHSLSLFFFKCWQSSTAVELFHCLCAEFGQNREKTDPLKPRLGTHKRIISRSQWWHQHVYQTNMIIRLGFRVGGERLRVRMGKREKRSIYGFHVAVAVIFSGLPESHFASYTFVGWSQLGVKHPDTEVYLYREVMETVTVLPLKSWGYALLMKCDGEQSRVCLYRTESMFICCNIHACQASFPCSD